MQHVFVQGWVGSCVYGRVCEGMWRCCWRFSTWLPCRTQTWGCPLGLAITSQHDGNFRLGGVRREKPTCLTPVSGLSYL